MSNFIYSQINELFKGVDLPNALCKGATAYVKDPIGGSLRLDHDGQQWVRTYGLDNERENKLLLTIRQHEYLSRQAIAKQAGVAFLSNGKCDYDESRFA